MNKPMLETWSSKIKVVDSVRGGMSDDAKTTLARVLENTNKTLADLRAIRNEGVCRNLGCETPASNMSGIDWFPEHSIDMVSAIYASQIIDDIVSVQSIDSPLGVIRFLKYVYGNDRGRVSREEVAIDEWGAMRGVDHGNFVARELVENELVGTVTTGGELSGFLQLLPVREDSPVRLVNEHDQSTFVAERTKTEEGKIANGWTVFRVTPNGSKSPVADAHFSLDGASGKILFTCADIKVDETWVASYYQDLSYCPTDSMNLEVRVKTEMIKAVPHKIRANFAFDASYALSKVHGINIEESLVNACTAEIRQERDNEVINILMRQAGGSSTWSRKVTSYISQHEHDMSFISELFACASMINFKTKRGFGNWVVVGRQGLNIIKSAGSTRFTAAGATLPNNGAFVAGDIEGMKVIYSPYIAEDAYLVGYKGSDMDAGFVVADFLPVTKTDMVMLDDFIGRQGLVSYYGTKMLNPDMYVRGKITDVVLAK